MPRHAFSIKQTTVSCILAFLTSPSIMEFTFTHKSPLNTQIIWPGISFDVSSQGTFSKTTVIRRDGNAVAEIEWGVSSTLRMGGQAYKVKDFLRRSGWFSR